MTCCFFFFFTFIYTFFSPFCHQNIYSSSCQATKCLKTNHLHVFLGRLCAQNKWELDSRHNTHPSSVFRSPWLQHNVLKRYRLACIGQRLHLFHVQPLSMCACPCSDPALGLVALQHFVPAYRAVFGFLLHTNAEKMKRLSRLRLRLPANWARVSLLFWFQMFKCISLILLSIWDLFLSLVSKTGFLSVAKTTTMKVLLLFI